ncbi:MAG: fatty acid CoA ligase family protein [Opitutales bacterium]|nr:fatty acid CoA ligase family protein [Opitutales bacterium]
MPDRFACKNLVSHLAETAKRSPHQTAIFSASKNNFTKRNFKELSEDVARCATYLQTKGLTKGQKALLFVKPGYELTVLAFSVIYLGVIPVIIDPGMGFRSVLSCIRSTKPDILIGLPLVMWLSFVFRNSFKAVHTKIQISKNFLNKHILSASSRPYWPQASTTEEELAAIVFTSGSTGAPKGVKYLHKNFNSQVDSLQGNFDIAHGEIDLATLPIFSLFNPALGVTTIVPEMNPRKPASADARSLVESIKSHGITTAFASPVIGKKIADYCIKHDQILPSLQRIFLAGAPSPPGLIEDLSKILVHGEVIVPYGATEALPVSFATAKQIIQSQKSILAGEGSYLGNPAPGVSVKIFPSLAPALSAKLGEHGELTRGQIGEICVAGDIVTDGYYRMPGASIDARFSYENKTFHRMGDLGYFDQDHCLRFLGRKAECIQTENGLLETERCEPMINAIPCIKKSALIGIGNAKKQEPCIVVEPLRADFTEKKKREVSQKILSILTTSFPQFNFMRVFWEPSIPVDARHNAKIHRLSLSKKWTRIVQGQSKAGIFS